MTSRSSDRIAALARRRQKLAADYAKARRRHRGAAGAGRKLRQATIAQLAAEVALAKASPLRNFAAARAAAEPDLFREMTP